MPFPISSPGGDPTSRRVLGLALAAGAAAIVLYELWQLFRTALTGPGGMERGAVWAILLMILVTFATVGGIGYGLYRALQDSGDSSDRDGPADPA